MYPRFTKIASSKPRKSHQHQSWREQQTTHLPRSALVDLPLAAHSQGEFTVFNHFHGRLPRTLHGAVQAMDGTLAEIRDGSVSFSGGRKPEEGTMDYKVNTIFLNSEQTLAVACSHRPFALVGPLQVTNKERTNLKITLPRRHPHCHLS